MGVQRALEAGKHQGDGGGGTGGGGHDVRGTGTGTTQVGVTSVEDLVSDVEVGGRHGPVLDSEGVPKTLHMKGIPLVVQAALDTTFSAAGW